MVLRHWGLEFNQFRLHLYSHCELLAYRTCGASHYVPSSLAALLACYGPLYLSAPGKPVVLEGYLPSTLCSSGAIETSAEAAHHRVPVISLTFDGTGFDGPFHFTMKLNLDMAYLAEMESLLDERIATLWIGERVVAVSTFEAVE